MSAPLLLLLASVTQAPAQSEWTEVLRIGGHESDVPFSEIGGFALFESGEFAVGQPLAGEVWHFDADGSQLYKVGRRGRGPGEFRRIQSLSARGDSLIVVDLYRTHVFIKDSLIATLGGVALGEESLRSPLMHPFGSDEWILIEQRLARHLSHPSRVAVWGADRSSPRTIGWLERGDSLRVGTDERTGLRLYLPSPVHYADRWTFVRQPPRIAVLEQQRVTEESARATARLHTLTMSGDTIRTLRFSGAAASVPEDAYDDVVRDIVRSALRNRPFSEDQVARAVNDALVRYEHAPLFDRLVAGIEGSIWLRLSGFGAEHRAWVRYDGMGNMIDKISLAADEEILAADDNNLWVSGADEFDVPHLRRLRTARRGSASR